MIISMESALEHMKWANQGVFSLISQLPDAALNAYVTNSEWNVAEILRHIAFSSGRYCERLSGKPTEKIEIPQTMNDLLIITEKLHDSDAELLILAEEPEGDVAVSRDGQTSLWKRSTIISQAVHHATEHRAQANSALEAKGFNPVDLDNFDVWSYESRNGIRFVN